MARVKPMGKASHVSDDGRELIVDITHENWQSYSRAVEPAAMRHARQAAYSLPNVGTVKGLSLVKVDHDSQGYVSRTRCVTRYHFAIEREAREKVW